MKRALLLVVFLAVLAIGAWALFGGVDRWSEARIAEELVAKGVSQQTAECMAGRMVDRLSVAQLRKLQRLQPEEGEAATPSSATDLLERVRRIDDPEVVEVTGTAAAVCALGFR